MSVKANGKEVPGADSVEASISANGRYVAFASDGKFVNKDKNNYADVYVKDLQTGRVTLASLDTKNHQVNANAIEPALSADGRHVAFLSDGAFDPNDMNGYRDAYVRNLGQDRVGECDLQRHPGRSTTGTGGMAGTATDSNAAGPMPIRRLTQREYNNTVADLVGDTTHPADGFPDDEHLDGVDDNYPFPVAADVDSLLATRLRDAASALAAAANLQTLLPCTPTAATEPTCLGQFLDTFGARAYRRPLLPTERTLLTGLYQQVRTSEQLDFNGGIRAVIEAMLQSAAFLYHWELGPQAPTLEGDLVRLGPYEIASRLSYFLWVSMPDDTLLAAAAANQLSTEDQIKQQATRLLADTRARQNLQTFYDQWMGLDQLPGRTKDAATYPQFTDAVKADMAREIDTLVANVALDGDGRLDSLLTSTAATITPALAPLYGLKLSGTGAQQVQLDSNQRAGLLTRAGFQALFGGASGSNPVKRGVEIYKRLLCGHLTPPPPNVPMPKDPRKAGRLASGSRNTNRMPARRDATRSSTSSGLGSRTMTASASSARRTTACLSMRAALSPWMVRPSPSPTDDK